MKTVTNLVVLVEVEWLKSVEDEISHVLVHVRVDDPTIEVVDHTTTIHHLETYGIVSTLSVAPSLNVSVSLR